MQLDDVVSSLTTGPRVEEAMWRSIRWLDRCIEAHISSGKATKQNLFAIIQGGLDNDLRDKCLDAMVERKHSIPGYAIGGLSGGEEKDVFWKMYVMTCMVPDGGCQLMAHAQNIAVHRQTTRRQ